jgi:hypothetical protein
MTNYPLYELREEPGGEFRLWLYFSPTDIQRSIVTYRDPIGIMREFGMTKALIRLQSQVDDFEAGEVEGDRPASPPHQMPSDESQP